MNPIKLWFSYEENLKNINKAFKKNMVQDKKEYGEKKMTKILTAKKYKSNNPFTKYIQKNIEERYLVYHEDWEKFEQVKQKLIEEGWQVRVWDVVEEGSEDVYKQYQERCLYFTAPSKTILAQKIATTSMKCLKCGTVMMQQQYFGGGIYWLCGKCGAKIERTGI